MRRPPGAPSTDRSVAPGGTALPNHSYGPLLDALRGLRWPARTRSRAPSAGQHPSRRRGSDVELTEYRAYRQGDDPRRMDWKVLARTDRAYLRVTDEHAVLPTQIAIDGSASMAYPAPGNDKWRLACALATGLASVAHAAGDQVSVIASTTKPVHLAYRSNRTLIASIIRALDGSAPSGTSDLSRLLSASGPAGRLVIISDLLDVGELLRTARLYRQMAVDVMVAHVVADQELDPPRVARVVDPEDPDTIRNLDDTARSAYLSRFADWRAATMRSWQNLGARYLMISTGEAPEHAVRRIVAA